MRKNIFSKFPLGNKKAIVWSELARWILVGALIIIIILAIIGPTRRAMFSKLSELVDILRFGI